MNKPTPNHTVRVPNPGLEIIKAKMAIAATAMKALGPEHERAAEQLADRVMAIIEKYAAAVRDGEAPERLEALGRGIGESCQVTLELAGALVAWRRGQ